MGFELSKLRQMMRVDLNISRDGYDRVFAYLLIASIVLRMAWLDVPKGSLIFDER